MIYEIQRNNYILSTDKVKLDHAFIHRYLSQESYWALGRTTERIDRSIENSLCFGIYQERQVGFARVVSDYATFAWLCDVFIIEEERRQGLGKWLVESIVRHPDLQDLKNFLLATRDAHELYRRYGGFESLPAPEKWMIKPPI